MICRYYYLHLNFHNVFRIMHNVFSKQYNLLALIVLNKKLGLFQIKYGQHCSEQLLEYYIFDL